MTKGFTIALGCALTISAAARAETTDGTCVTPAEDGLSSIFDSIAKIVKSAEAIAAKLPPAAPPTAAEIAEHWAPSFYQDTDDSDARADYITRVDYDGNWKGNDNWDHLHDAHVDLSAHVYYSVVETADRYYITYADFHARDWDEPCKYPFVGKDRCHENDMEGATIVVKKDGTRFGSFELVATQAHGKMLVARNDHRIAKGTNEHLTDAPVTFDGGSHAQLFVQSKGHGVCVMHDSACGQEPGKFPGGDGIYYHVGDAAETPSSGNDRDVAFALTPMADTLWARRHDIGTDASLFGRGMKIGGETVGGAFNGGDHEDDAANPPWAWHDGGSGSGDVLLRPAETFNRWVKRPAPASTAYVSNPFRNGSS